MHSISIYLVLVVCCQFASLSLGVVVGRKESPFLFDADARQISVAAFAPAELSNLFFHNGESEKETCRNYERVVSSGGYGILKSQDFLPERPRNEVKDGIFVNNREDVSFVGDISKVKNVHIDDAFLSMDESKSILNMVENDLTFAPHPEPGWFQYAYINVHDFPKLQNNQTFLERVCEKMGVSFELAKKPEYFRVKKFLPGSMVPLHIDNKGEWDVSIVIYFADSHASPLMFPGLNLSVEARSGRAIVFLNRDYEQKIDFNSAHHTVATTEGYKYSVGFTFRVESNKRREYFTNFNPFHHHQSNLLKNSIVTFHHCATCSAGVCNNGEPCVAPVGNSCRLCTPSGSTSSCTGGSPTPGYSCFNGNCVAGNCRKWTRNPRQCAALGGGCRYIFPTNSAFNRLGSPRINQCRKLGDFGCRAKTDCKFKCRDVCLLDKQCRSSC